MLLVALLARFWTKIADVATFLRVMDLPAQTAQSKPHKKILCVVAKALQVTLQYIDQLLHSLIVSMVP
jgi:hypothetical protein